MNISIKLDGLGDALEKLSDVPEKAARGLEIGLMRGGEIVRTEAQANCPRDTGALQESIIVQQVDGTTVSVGTNIEYGIYVEFGTGSKGNPSVGHTTKEGWVYFNENTGKFVYTTGQAPQPFLVPALLSQKEAIVEAVKQGLLEVV